MHPEAITSKAKNLLDRLGKFPHYYLAGGTGLALQLGHRVSADFDFFSGEHNSVGALDKVENVFGKHQTQILINEESQLTFSADDVEISLIHYPFPVVAELLEWEGLRILSAEEIAAMKAYTLGRRATFKDYVDLYYVVKDSVAGLEDIIRLANRKHGKDFDPRLFLEQLVYLEDVLEQEVRFLKAPVNRQNIINFFESKVKRLDLE